METKTNPSPSFQIIEESRLQFLENGIEEIKSALKGLNPGVNYPEYLTVKEFCAAVKIGRSKFDELVANNELEYVRKGRKYYIHVDQVKAYFQSN